MIKTIVLPPWNPWKNGDFLLLTTKEEILPTGIEKEESDYDETQRKYECIS